jgi:hypothetical protein
MSMPTEFAPVDSSPVMMLRACRERAELVALKGLRGGIPEPELVVFYLAVDSPAAAPILEADVPAATLAAARRKRRPADVRGAITWPTTGALAARLLVGSILDPATLDTPVPAGYFRLIVGMGDRLAAMALPIPH